MVLLRHLLGDVLRRLRLRQGRTLREVSASARVSLGYLSEVERGQKEASSELLSAICTALETPLSQVLREVSDNFALAELQNAPVLTGPREPVLPREPALHPDRPTATSRNQPRQTSLVTPPDAVLGAVRLGAGRPDLRSAGSAMLPDDTGFDRVTHSGDVTTMVPV